MNSVLSLMEPLLKCRLVDADKPSERLRALSRLKCFLATMRGPDLVHSCCFGCHRSVEDAKKEAFTLIDTIWLRRPNYFVA